MKPLINSEGHLRALEDYMKFLPKGPSEQIGWTLEQGWNVFLAGHAVNGADLGRSTHVSPGPRPLQRARSSGCNDHSRDNGGFQPADERMEKKLAKYCRKYERRDLALCDFEKIQTERGGVRFPRVHGK